MTLTVARRRLATAEGAGIAQHLAAPLVGAAAGIAGLWMLTILLQRGTALTTPAYDLAFFQQVVWNAAHGAGFVSSFNGGSFLGLHFSPLLVVPAGIELFWPDARALTIVHVVGLVAAGPAAFLLLRALLRPASSATLLAALLAAPLPVWSAMQEAALADFHTEALSLPLALLVGWAGLTRRTWLLYGLALLVLAAKEDQGYALLVVGLLVAARAPGRLWSGGALWRGGRPARGARLHGAILAAVAVVWTPIVFAVVMPALRGGTRLETAWYYNWLFDEGGPLGQRDRIIAQLTAVDGWLSITGMIVSMAALPLLRPRWLLLVAPPAVANLLSANVAQADVHLHYTLTLMVPTVVSGGLGARRLLAWQRRWQGRRRARGALLALILVPALAVAWIGGGLPPTARYSRAQFTAPPARAALEAISAPVPRDALLVVDDGLAPTLASRARIELVPADDPEAWVIVDRDTLLPGYVSRAGRERFVVALPRSGRALVADDGRFQLWGPVDG